MNLINYARSRISFIPTRKVNFGSLVLELTRKCTKRCNHCANYSGPEADGFMNTGKALNLIREAKQLDFRRVRLTGGEALLHPGMSAIVKYVFRNNLELILASNGFWGITEDAALEKFSELLGMKPNNLRMQLVLSCDPFHVTQFKTDLDKISNILKAAIKLNRNDLMIILNFQNLFNDPVLSSLSRRFPKEFLLSKGQMTLFDRGVLIRLKKNAADTVILAIKSPLDLSVGRAKELPHALRASLPLSEKQTTKKVYPFFCGIIYVSFDGQFYADFLHAGEKIYPLGSLADFSLKGIVADAQKDPFFNMLNNVPADTMIKALDEVVPIEPFLEESHSPSEFFSRLYLYKA